MVNWKRREPISTIGVPTEDVGTAFEGMNVAVDPPIGGKPAQSELCVHCSGTPAHETGTRKTTSMSGVIVGPVIRE